MPSQLIPLDNVHVLKPDAEVGITAEHITGLAENYGTNGHRAPIVLGHPKDNSPAWGWVKACREEPGSNLVCDLDVTTEFKELLDRGLFRERSIAFYPTDPPSLRHIGFLGAVPPRIKGLESVNLSESIEPYMSVTTQLPSAAPATEAPLNQFLRPVVLYALSEAMPGVTASNLTTEPVLQGDSITGLVELSDGRSFSYVLAKSGENWKAETTLRNPEVVTLSEKVNALETQLATQAAAVRVKQLYADHRLTEAILPQAEAVQLVSLCEGPASRILNKMLDNLPPLVASAPLTQTAEAKPTGFGGFELSDHGKYLQVMAKVTELGLNPHSDADFAKALSQL